MKNKIIDYSLAKELHELGFDFDSYTGWYGYSDITEDTLYFGDTTPDAEEIKAYCSDDLLMWLKDNSDFDVVDLLYALKDDNNFYAYYSINNFQDACEDPKPSNALAKAIITILKEKQNNEK